MFYAFYSLATGRVFQRSRLSAGESVRAARKGEGILLLDQAIFDLWLSQWRGDGSRDAIQEFVNSQTGMSPDKLLQVTIGSVVQTALMATDAYATVQNGVVTNIVTGADPVLGHLDTELAKPGATVVPILGAYVQVGAAYTLGAFVNPPDLPPVLNKIPLGNVSL